MDIQYLRDHIRQLASVSETDSPFISCYLNTDRTKGEIFREFAQRTYRLEKSLSGKKLIEFKAAVEEIGQFLKDSLQTKSKGVAIFARSGEEPFFLPLQFEVDVPDHISINTLPSIYHLIELKDSYHRYVVVVSTKRSGRILEINMGSVTETIFAERPDLRKRVGREWTREHYQNHRRDRGDRFIKEKIKILERLMLKKGYGHLILAGAPEMTSRLEKALPKQLRDKLIDTTIHGEVRNMSEVIRNSLEIFLEEEQKESHDLVKTLEQAIASDGLVALGPMSSGKALEMGVVDVLLLSQEFPYTWMREELVRSAARQGVQIETVSGNPTLESYGGAACLLRFKMAGNLLNYGAFDEAPVGVAA